MTAKILYLPTASCSQFVQPLDESSQVPEDPFQSSEAPLPPPDLSHRSYAMHLEVAKYYRS